MAAGTRWDALLLPFLTASTDAAADNALDYLVREFVTPLVTSVLTRELRRGNARSQAQIWADTETFEELLTTVQEALVRRLRLWRERREAGDTSLRPVTQFRAYVRAVARHAYADYVRGRRPGRHALDTALRAALSTASDIALWKQPVRIDFFLWHCGYSAWKAEGKPSVSLSADAALRTSLWRRLRDQELTKAEVLRAVFDTAQQPLFYADLLDFLAALWDVEAPYRAHAGEFSALRVETPAAQVEDPARVVQLIGALQGVWVQMQPLSSVQKAVLLLHLPYADERSILEEFVHRDIVSETALAQAIGLTPEELRFQYSELPLEDSAIAALLELPVADVRRIRQDARRRLNRQAQ